MTSSHGTSPRRVRRAPRVGAVALAAVLLLTATGCADEDPVPVASAVPADGATDDATEAPGGDPTGGPTATAAPTPTPTPTPSGTPSPTPSATPSGEPDLREDTAIAAAIDRRASRPECGSDELPDDFHEVIARTDQGLLTFVVCFLGAYQASGELLLFDGFRLVDVGVQQWVGGGTGTTPEVTGYLAELSGGRIVNEVKYRGLGDCGLQQIWDVTDEGLVLQIAREQECTDGGAYVPPDQWPVVYER